MSFVFSFLALFASSVVGQNAKLDKKLNNELTYGKATDKLRVIVLAGAVNPVANVNTKAPQSQTAMPSSSTRRPGVQPLSGKRPFGMKPLSGMKP
jgi:hypothetical protein